MLSFAILAQSGVFATIRQSLPTDPAALFTLALSAVGIAAVLIAGRKKGPGSGPKGAAR
ncbi:MAG TPA: hypothetical protein VLA36_14915 [Longimicrobiales bacterium]|nr:hypothetical protein [Longimicrobiales bacterium]